MPDVEMDHLVDKDILDVILLQVEAAADSYGTFSTEGMSRVAADGMAECAEAGACVGYAQGDCRKDAPEAEGVESAETVVDEIESSVHGAGIIMKARALLGAGLGRLGQAWAGQSAALEQNSFASGQARGGGRGAGEAGLRRRERRGGGRIAGEAGLRWRERRGAVLFRSGAAAGGAETGKMRTLLWGLIFYEGEGNDGKKENKSGKWENMFYNI